MALITIERIIPAPLQNNILLNSSEKDPNNDSTNSCSHYTLNEIYIAVRGADIIFPYNECHRFSKTSQKSILNDIQKHLQAIFKILRPQDTMKMAVRLESQLRSTRTRYLLVVSNESDQSCLLGIDYEEEATIGLVLSIWNDMKITLDGDGGFRITSGNKHHIFKPVSVQAMWSAFQALHLATKKSITNNYYEGGGSHCWVAYYKNRINSNQICLHEWHTITDLSESSNNNKLYDIENKPKEQLNFEELVRSKLKTVMMSVDLEQVTSKEIRNKLEAHFQRDLSEYKSYIDKEMIKIMGQMEESSKILDYLYLGSEWNASNFEELKGKGVKKIINVTCEIDNFFPGSFDYYNIRVDDDECTDMLRYLNQTYYYIRKAKDEGVKVLVHCKKGISRSASVVVAYIMKEKSCHLYEALEYVKTQRSNIRPNPEFLKQLQIYEGMLKAHKLPLTRSSSESDLTLNSTKWKNCDEKRRCKSPKKADDQNGQSKFYSRTVNHRRRSWPPKVNNDSDYLMFDDKENEKKGAFPAMYCINNKEMEIKSRVKERIEDFENNKQSSINNKGSNLLKLNVAKNGMVSNLANQFEFQLKDKAMSDLSNFDQFQRNGSKLTKQTKFVLCDEFATNLDTVAQFSSSKSVDGRYSCKYSNRILKRTLSLDNILEISRNIDSINIIALKKCKKSLCRLKEERHNTNDEEEEETNQSNYLQKSRSLPNIYVNSPSFKRMIIDNYINVVRPTHSKPLDLQYYQAHISQHVDNQSDGFVKRRTEELENQAGESCLAKSSSMPSSPNFPKSSIVNKLKDNTKKGCKGHHHLVGKTRATKSFTYHHHTPPNHEKSFNHLSHKKLR